MKKYVRNMEKDIEKMKKVLYHIKYKGMENDIKTV